jgi:ubiquinone biosynthesis monooxygenase Coq7
VNHAGEFGAIRIYGAQHLLTRRFWPDVADKIAGLRGHEIEHCIQFRAAMRDRAIRPCRAMYLWSLGGWLLGAATALLGPKAVWTCTEAVEAAVHEHLSAQLRYLEGRDPEFHDMIASIQAEEEGHLALALSEKGATNAAVDLLGAVIGRSVHLVVWLSTWGDSARMSRELAKARA